MFTVVFFFKQKTAYEISACLVGSDRPDQAMLVSLAGLVTTMMLLVREISSLFELVKTLFGF